MGMAADAQGACRGDGERTVATAGPDNLTNRGHSALKLTPSGSTLQVSSYFTPPLPAATTPIYSDDGSLLIPNSSYFFTGTKRDPVFLKQDDMGGLSSTQSGATSLPLGSSANMHCQAAYYQGARREFVYVWSENDVLRGSRSTAAATCWIAVARSISKPADRPAKRRGAIVSSNGATAGTYSLGGLRVHRYRECRHAGILGRSMPWTSPGSSGQSAKSGPRWRGYLCEVLGRRRSPTDTCTCRSFPTRSSCTDCSSRGALLQGKPPTRALRGHEHILRPPTV